MWKKQIENEMKKNEQVKENTRDRMKWQEMVKTNIKGNLANWG